VGSHLFQEGERDQWHQKRGIQNWNKKEKRKRRKTNVAERLRRRKKEFGVFWDDLTFSLLQRKERGERWVVTWSGILL